MKIIKFFAIFIFLSTFTFAIATVDIGVGGGGNVTQQWKEQGNDIYYDDGKVQVGFGTSLSPLFLYNFNAYGLGGGSTIMQTNYDPTLHPISTGIQHRKGNFLALYNSYTRINNARVVTQGSTFVTEHTVSGSGVMTNHTQSVYGAIYDTKVSGNSIGGTSTIFGAVFNTHSTLLSANNRVIGGYFKAIGGSGFPPQNYAIYADGDSVLGNNGRTNQMIQAPHECVAYNNQFANVYSTSKSFLGEAGNAYSPFDIMCIQYVPYGYQFTEITVFGTPSRTVEVYTSTVQSGISTLQATCTTSIACVPAIPIAETADGYVIVFIELTASTDRVQGIRYTMERQFQPVLDYEVTP